jgi:CheY-like chemotaxis protein
MPPSSPNTQKSPVVVLVVEDEEVIRTLATEFMAEMGFDVLEAPNGDTAVRILQTEAERVHVLFTDLRMPGAMDGLTLAHHTRRNWPWIDLVVTSGFVAGALQQLPADTQFFRKPYDLPAIAEHIRRTRRPS